MCYSFERKDVIQWSQVTVASVMPGRNDVVLARGCKLTADKNITECKDATWDGIALPGVSIL